jgi:protein-S-isoprenylcysteine O-methyltransferase Ste14
MILFYVGIVILLIISLVEFNPSRYKKGMNHLDTDKNSGTYLTVTSVLVGLGSILDYFFNFIILRTSINSFLILTGILLMISGFVIRTRSVQELGLNFNYAVAPVKNLHTEGIYKKIRHPSYLGTLLYSIGIPLLFLSGIGIIFTPLVFISILYRIRVEEEFLKKSLGEKYINYKKITYRLIPYLY